ncbi:hypothetical protein TL16_g10811 [Triparma laevis f. inornata]|uniref:RING-type domain-containing protein n=1 Tax=Triparma laevis f. inornata TaxID=1714386 RepID=A0A9W7ERH7_9STRA|nr:hypothetical protein TL16_g10811 [Triparma laevis f. inornata]
MISSQSPSKPTAAAKPPPYCAFPNCKVPPTKTCSRCNETQNYSKEHQLDHWRWHKKMCVAPQKKISAPVPPPPVPLKGSVDEEEKDEDKCAICLVNAPNAQMRPCGHSMICRYCTQELMTRCQPYPICRKPLVGFDVGVYSGSLGERGMWPTSAKNLRELAIYDGFNRYFRKQFNGNEESFLRWKEVFDVLEIVGGRGNHCTVRESME